ncbi:secernin-3 [Anthonomus grandis grandis]|uniref:secernin-3 n=1 Tax=Anthonomus grandis grandis TaxID=2921223 RepID=UPI0021662B81|nr:secernin-3 [Anthonomus grandis grandis]XP_050307017.1 secernin-3 [Anthonomus grandis grandis]
MEAPLPSDTFVVLPPLTDHGVVFGRNSGGPRGEIQEVIYVPSKEPSGPIQCTYMEVDPAGKTKAVILSKPNWMWGAEMGANECGVTIGNQAIQTNDNDGDSDPNVKRLLGTDLVRLGLERSSNADEALNVITNLLEKYGQGGPCSKSEGGCAYHNSFLIADSECAWVLETCGKHWAAEKITSGFRNISNLLTITTKIDKKSQGLEEYAKNKGLWDGNGEFNFSQAFSAEGKSEVRYLAGQKLLGKFTSSNSFRETDMFKILRDKESGICRDCDDGFPTTGSQVSTLTSTRPSVHWFTATPDPSRSVFKPFIFTKNVAISKHTICPDKENPHTLYILYKKSESNKGVQDLLHEMESNCVKELDQVISTVGEDLSEFDELLKDCVETEVKFYR